MIYHLLIVNSTNQFDNRFMSIAYRYIASFIQIIPISIANH